MTGSPSSIATPTVHLVGPGKIKVINGRLAYSNGNGRPTRLDQTKLQYVVCYGNVGVTDDAFTMLFQNNIEVSWLSANGSRCRGRLARSVDSTTALRIIQHRVLLDQASKLELARHVVLAKIDSQCEAARHFQRHGAAGATLFRQQAIRGCDAAKATCDADVLRGVEGSCTKAWFSLWGSRLTSPWSFPGRARRPPPDPVNALLSLGYTWLLNRLVARIQAAGLESNLGALHEFRPGRPSLGCDLIEPLRVPIVDRWVLKRCNRGPLSTDDFEAVPGRGVMLKHDRFTNVLTLWEEDWHSGKHQHRLEKHIQGFISELRTASRRLEG